MRKLINGVIKDTDMMQYIGSREIHNYNNTVGEITIFVEKDVDNTRQYYEEITGITDVFAPKDDLYHIGQFTEFLHYVELNDWATDQEVLNHIEKMQNMGVR